MRTVRRDWPWADGLLAAGRPKLGPGTYACINLGSTVSSNSMLYSMDTFAEKTVRMVGRQGSAPLEGGEGRVNAGSHFPAYRLTDSGGNRTSTSKCLTRPRAREQIQGPVADPTARCIIPCSLRWITGLCETEKGVLDPFL